MFLDRSVQLLKVETTASAAVTPSALSLNSLVFLLWPLGTVTVLSIFFIATLSEKRRLSQGHPIDMIRCGRRRIPIKLNNRISSPQSIGIFPDCIYVPSYWQELTIEWRTLLMHHEPAHIQRRDNLLKLLQRIALAFYFFHPLVWLLQQRIDDYREMTCDAAAAQAIRAIEWKPAIKEGKPVQVRVVLPVVFKLQ